MSLKVHLYGVVYVDLLIGFCMSWSFLDTVLLDDLRYTVSSSALYRFFGVTERVKAEFALSY